LIIASPLEKLVAHLSCAGPLELDPALSGGNGLLRFDVNARCVVQPFFEPLKHRGQRILPERGVEENHVEALARAIEELERIAEHEIDALRADHVARRL
jgi:hypothetical protein